MVEKGWPELGTFVIRLSSTQCPDKSRRAQMLGIVSFKIMVRLT
jgi:hypothetical protein